MTSAREHYDQLLGPIYTWMVGGIESALERGAAELDAIVEKPSEAKTAVDLGAGFGMHAIPLARRGFNVLALDSSAALLDELRVQSNALPIQRVQDDLLSFSQYLSEKPDLVLCMGDTLTHLPDHASVMELIATISAKTKVGGRFVATLRDYSTALAAEQRFIPVRSDENRILTCFLEYSESYVAVNDIVYEREGSHWNMSVSKYNKLRISPEWLASSLQEHGFSVNRKPDVSGMVRFVADRA